MFEDQNYFKQFREKGHKELFEIIKKQMSLNELEAEKTVYSIYVITELIEKIYTQLIPEMVSNSELSKESLNDKFDNIKFNFNEIRQLIETAKLTDLKYWEDETE